MVEARQRPGDALGPVTLSGKYVRLEPLREEHHEYLLEVAQEDERIWQWMPVTLDTAASLSGFIRDARLAESAGREFAFAIFSWKTGRVVGSTRYMDIAPESRGVEIGWTWYSPRVWGTEINPEAKLLLMSHAFERWGAIRVYLKTDERNERSRGAILNLGAKFEGILRNHRIRQDGSYRGSAVYSVVVEEWPEIKARLKERLAGGHASLDDGDGRS